MMSMEFKRVTLENIEEEHICCAISDKKGETCVASKKAWLKERLKEGLVFEKLDVRGKVFIEYLPAEYAWVPVDADGYYYIDCLWVSGQYKGQGYTSCWSTVSLRPGLTGRRGLLYFPLRRRCRFCRMAPT